MPRRIMPIVTNQIYHIITKSHYCPASFIDAPDYRRMVEAIKFYRFIDHPGKLSCYLQNQKVVSNNSACLLDIIAFCLMPNHIHLLLRQKSDNGISKFMSLILNSYTKYFNLKHERQGPMWEKRFKHVCVESDGQFVHLTRYIHLNPVTAHLTENPENWKASSYPEYLEKTSAEKCLCEFQKLVNMRPESYRKFVENQIAYQRELAKIKKLLLD